jgi:hypothetical protein
MDKELYVSIDCREYKENKQNLLNSKIDLLNSVKHLQNFRGVLTEKNKLKFQLFKLFFELLGNLKSLEERFPEVPRSKKKVKKEFISRIESSIDEQENNRKQVQIEQELREIQEKLKQLNK